MIRRSVESDFEKTLSIINDGAEAYRGIIPADRWSEPYMSRAKLRSEIEDGVDFWVYEQSSMPLAVMGIQKAEDVTLIRHAYVKTAARRRGLGGNLLTHLRRLTTDPILIGTWADATWALRFYERYGFQMVSVTEKERLLRRYWSVPERQIETSVVLADARWRNAIGLDLPPEELMR